MRADAIQRVVPLPEKRRIALRGCEDTGVDRPGIDDEGIGVSPSHGDAPHDRSGAERASVDGPGNLDSDHVRDRRDHVGRVRASPVDPPLTLPRVLHEERHPGDVGDVPGTHVAPGASGDEARSVIRGQDHERTVVDTGPLQLRDEHAEQAVGVADLEQVTLQGLIHEPR